MNNKKDFAAGISSGYQPKQDFIYPGAAMCQSEVVPEAAVKIPLKRLNRHGLIAGATGTGKSENLSAKGVPVLLHALRAFSARDRKAIKLAAENFPDSAYYDTKNIITSLGTDEALLTALDEKGRPTPLAATLVRAPQSRMNILTAEELTNMISTSKVEQKYNVNIDQESAHQILTHKIESADVDKAGKHAKSEGRKVERSSNKKRRSTSTETEKALERCLSVQPLFAE